MLTFITSTSFWSGSFVQCCFTSTETVRTIREWGAQDGHLDFHIAFELCLVESPLAIREIQINVVAHREIQTNLQPVEGVIRSNVLAN